MSILTLTKAGQTTSLLTLAKEAGNTALNSILLGAGWDKEGDNDLSVLFLDATKNVVGAVFSPLFNAPLEGAGVLQNYTNANVGDFKHGGDDTKGTSSAGGDDEAITGTLNSLPTSVEYMSVVINNFNGTPLAQFGELYTRVVDASNQTDLARVTVAELANAGTVGVVLATLHRKGGTWELVSTPVASVDPADVNFTGMTEEAVEAIALIA
jgi:tellurium resistance protein TerZ